MNNTTTYSRSMFGLTEINADVINTGSLNVSSTIQAPTVKTNLVQSINPTNSLTLEALTTGQVIIKSNGINIAVFDGSTGTITFIRKVYQNLGDAFISNASFGNLAGSLLPNSGSLMYGNSCFGAEAGRNINGASGAQGTYNTCIGFKSGRGITTGQQNTIIATEGFQSATSGTGNVAVGHQAGFSITTSSNNMLLGTGSSYGTTTGIDNVSCGYYAGVLQPSLQGTFGQNISFGREANQSVNGSSNIAIGWRANWTTFPSLLPAFTNSIVIGNNLSNSLSNQILIGGASQWLTTPRISIGKLTSPTTLLDVEGASLFNGSLSVRNGNNSQIFNNGNTQQTNCYMFNNDFYINNVAPTGTITYQINSTSIFSVASNQMNSSVFITVPLEPPLSSNSRVANTEYVDDAISVALTGLPTLSGANTWTGTNVFNNNIPTISTLLTPTTSQQLINLGFANATYATTANVNTAYQYGQEATAVINSYDDFFSSTSSPSDIAGGWVFNGTGSATFSMGTTKQHPGIWTLGNNRAIGFLSSIPTYLPDTIEWIARITSASNVFTLYAGIAQGYSNFTNSAFFGHTSGTTTLYASINNVNLYNFTTVTWLQNKWYSYKIIFNNPDVTFTIKNITDNLTESYTATASSFNFATNLFPQYQQIGTMTSEVDYFAFSYQTART